MVLSLQATLGTVISRLAGSDMALLQNITLNNQYPYRRSGGTATNTETGSMLSQIGLGNGREFTRFFGLPKTESLPGGYNPGIFMPLRHTYMSSWREAELTVSPVADGIMGLPAIATSTLTVTTESSSRLPLDDTPQVATAGSTLTFLAENSSRLPLDDTPPVATAQADFSIFTDTLFGNLITSGVGSSSFTFSTSTPLLIATMGGEGSTSWQLVTNTPLLGALAFNTASTSLFISSTGDILPINDTAPARTATVTFTFLGELEPFATGILDGDAFLAGGTIDEFAVLGRMEYDNAVHIDVINGASGTRNPTGTLASPVNNLVDALAIARGLNLTRLKLLSDLTIAAGEDVSQYTLFSDTWKVCTVETGAVTTDTVFERISIYGELCGTWNIFVDCWAYNVTNFLGWMRGGSLERIELAPYIDPDPFSLGSSYFDDVVPMYANIKSVLVMNTGVSVSFTACADIVEVQGMTAGSALVAALSGGQVIIDDSCVAGDIHVSGVGSCENNSALVIDETGLNSPNSITSAVWSYER